MSCIHLLIKFLFMEAKTFELLLTDYHHKIYIIHKTKFETSEPPHLLSPPTLTPCPPLKTDEILHYLLVNDLVGSWNACCYNKQEMPSRQQTSAKKGPQKYLTIRPNPISVILRMDVSLIRKTCVSVFYGEP